MPTTQDRARALLGPSCHGPDDAVRHFAAAYSAAQRASFARVPFSEELLRACRDTHLLVAGAPLSILDIIARHRRLFWPRDLAEATHAFVPVRAGVRWHLLRKDHVPASTGRTFGEQVSLLEEDERVPLACEVVYAMVLHRLASGELLTQRVFARCADVSPDGRNAVFGVFFRHGPFVVDWVDDRRDDYLGLAVAQIPAVLPA